MKKIVVAATLSIAMSSISMAEELPEPIVTQSEPGAASVAGGSQWWVMPLLIGAFIFAAANGSECPSCED